jgi:monoamine oxidase
MITVIKAARFPGSISMLKGFTHATVWLLALNLFISHAADPLAKPDSTVLIVGGGLTGLTTAHELTKAGIDSLILEASPRVGGRIQSVRFKNGDTCEAHMEEYFERNPAYQLLKELELPLAEDVAHSTVRLGGKIYPYQGDGDRDEYLRGIFSEKEIAAFLKWNNKTWAFYEELHASHFSDKPLPPELVALTKISFAKFVAREGLPKKVREWIRVTVEPEMAIEWDKISALDGVDEMRLFLDTPQGFGEKNYHVKGGNSKFTEALTARIGDRKPVVNAMVTAVRQTADAVTVRYLQDGYHYHEATGKYVVMTVPVPQLGRIQFEPPLSEEKKRAIATTRYGSYIKVHFGIAPEAARLWEVDGETVLTLLSDSSAGSVYDATDLQDAPEDRDRILTLLLHARFARAMTGLSADAIRQRAGDGLDALFPGVKQHIKFAEIFVYPEAVAYWPLELGRSRFDALARKLREPQGRLYIGGDMTENSHSEGAVQAALRMSKAIMQREGRTTPKL